MSTCATAGRSLVILGLLVAFAGGTIIAAVAGARRGDTALRRLDAVTLPATAVALPNQPGFDWGRVERLPEVASVSTFSVDYTLAYLGLPADVAASRPPTPPFSGRSRSPGSSRAGCSTPAVSVRPWSRRCSFMSPAIGAVGHALVTVIQRRIQDVAVLRVMGMRPRECRLIVFTQGLVLALARLLIGLLVGLVVGRLASVLGAWPAHRAARLRVANALRAE